MTCRGTCASAFAWLGLVASLAVGADPKPRAVDVGPDGRLVYRPDDRGNRVPDYSSSGYRGGGVSIPDVPVRVVVEPTPAGVDATATIQAAIDRVAGLESDRNGHRGAVLLRNGRHLVAGRLRIAAAGVVLRGGGATILVAAGPDRRTLVQCQGPGGVECEDAGAAAIVDDRVPIGSYTIRVDQPERFAPGQAVVVEHPSTAAWIAALGMDRFPPGDAGGWLRWQPGTLDVRFVRTVRAIDGDRLTLDAPLTTGFERAHGGGRVIPVRGDRRIREVGVENLAIESEVRPDRPADEDHAWDAVALENVADGWVRQVTFRHFAGSAVRVGDGSRRVTVEDCESFAPVSEVGGYRRHTFVAAGQATLFQRCRAEHGRHDFAAMATAAGPNVFLECETREALDFSGPVESWASGVLLDNITMMDGGALSLTNRETAGQGVGWAADGSVLWQCSAPVVTCRRPPTGQNWAIGCWGMFLGDGFWQMPNEFARPDSLYRAQLAERLGPAAVERIARRAIPVDPDSAPTIPPVLPSSGDPEPPRRPIAIQQGRIVEGGRLAIGGRTGTPWWRGQVLPARAATAEDAITRFVPGRTGRGFTDDLAEVADRLVARNTVALEHHWGLWYDRRRDDHEMVRRSDGDVWPPFYEQPWARSGQGRAWDGLSRYDLTAFNRWYFDRLDRFARECERTGRVLLHHAYFQHNILEAGAHWADFPWRPANTIQATGFPEPPPYLGRKRISVADTFYDVSDPERRRLHELYLRHVLDVLGRHPNVVFVLGEEFTGPVEFVRFWVDTVVAWERETGRDVTLALAATRDVQDAILADPVRGAAISAIDLKYWWYTADGRVYDPPGGQSLAPRQQLRAWPGKNRRGDEATARQVRELRRQHPDKAVLVADGGASGWFVAAAGGSLPNLPATTDPRLLADLATMTPTSPRGRTSGVADAGRAWLAVAPPGQPVELDLGASVGLVRVWIMDPRTGQPVGPAATISGGGLQTIPGRVEGPTVVWATREDPQP